MPDGGDTAYDDFSAVSTADLIAAARELAPLCTFARVRRTITALVDRLEETK